MASPIMLLGGGVGIGASKGTPNSVPLPSPQVFLLDVDSIPCLITAGSHPSPLFFEGGMCFVLLNYVLVHGVIVMWLHSTIFLQKA